MGLPLLGPAETTGYLILGYTVIFAVMLFHLASIRVRKRNLQADLELLKNSGKKASPLRKAKKKRK